MRLNSAALGLIVLTAALPLCAAYAAEPPPAAPAASSKEARAVTKPSGVSRATRTRQCAAEAHHKRLTGKNSRAFQVSCLATAGPVSEGETGAMEPHPAGQIKGIGVNNNAPSTTPAKSTPQS